MAAPDEWTRYAVAEEPHLEALHARYVSHRYDRHSHDFFVLGTVDSGAAEFGLGRGRVVAPQKSAMIINPGEMHDGVSRDDGGYVYSMVYVDPSEVRAVADELEFKQNDIEFRNPVVSDPRVVRSLHTLHRSIMLHAPNLDVEVAWIEAISTLLRLQSAEQAQSTHRDNPAALALATELINDCFSEKLTTARLAKSAGVSRVYLNELFTRHYGIPIHGFLNQVRMTRARTMLIQGGEPSDIAVAVGLNDQSHLNRRFKATYGISPGRFARSFTEVQYNEGHLG